MDIVGPLDIDIIIKLSFSFFLGLIVGIEREFAGKEAGPRTYSLVSLGVTLFTVLALDPRFGGEGATRIISQIIPGIGFIGAGLIIFHQSRVHGLTTAAGIWSMAAIGIAVGMGYYVISIFVTLLSLMVLYLFRRFDIEDRIHRLASIKEEKKH